MTPTPHPADPTFDVDLGTTAVTDRNVTTFTTRAGGVETTVFVRHEGTAGHSRVQLHITPAGAGTRPAAASLHPDQAQRLATALSASAFAAAGQHQPATASRTSPADGSDQPTAPPGECTEITGMEGTPAAHLAAALALLPPGTVLTDFGADTYVSLFFTAPMSLGSARVVDRGRKQREAAVGGPQSELNDGRPQ